MTTSVPLPCSLEIGRSKSSLALPVETEVIIKSYKAVVSFWILGLWTSSAFYGDLRVHVLVTEGKTSRMFCLAHRYIWLVSEWHVSDDESSVLLEWQCPRIRRGKRTADNFTEGTWWTKVTAFCAEGLGFERPAACLPKPHI